MGVVFPASPRDGFVSSFGRPVCSVAEWVPHSVVFASGVDSVCAPLANDGVGLGPSSSGPVASLPPLGFGLLRRHRGDSFHLGVFMRWSSTHGGLASGSSRSQASRYGLLVYVQGASDSLPRSSPGGEVTSLVSGKAVWVLLLATSLPLGIDVSLVPGRCLSVGARWSSSRRPTYVFSFLNSFFVLASALTRRFGYSMLCSSVALLLGTGVGCPLLSSRPF